MTRKRLRPVHPGEVHLQTGFELEVERDRLRHRLAREVRVLKQAS